MCLEMRHSRVLAGAAIRSRSARRARWQSERDNVGSSTRIVDGELATHE
jgi:hypothetical protein